MNSAPSTYHQYVSRRIQFQLYSQIELKDQGSVINAPVDVQLSDHDIVQPDIVVVLRANNIITPSKVKGPPEHIIEILSPSTEQNDRELKRTLYERAGVQEYWIVDPFEHFITQLVLVEQTYQQGPESKQSLPVSYIENVFLDLSQVW